MSPVGRTRIRSAAVLRAVRGPYARNGGTRTQSSVGNGATESFDFSPRSAHANPTGDGMLLGPARRYRVLHPQRNSRVNSESWGGSAADPLVAYVQSSATTAASGATLGRRFEVSHRRCRAPKMDQLRQGVYHAAASEVTRGRRRQRSTAAFIRRPPARQPSQCSSPRHALGSLPNDERPDAHADPRRAWHRDATWTS